VFSISFTYFFSPLRHPLLFWYQSRRMIHIHPDIHHICWFLPSFPFLILLSKKKKEKKKEDLSVTTIPVILDCILSRKGQSCTDALTLTSIRSCSNLKQHILDLKMRYSHQVGVFSSCLSPKVENNWALILKAQLMCLARDSNRSKVDWKMSRLQPSQSFRGLF